MTALNLNNCTLSSVKFVFPESDNYFVFLFPYLLNLEWILKLQTQHTKRYVRTCNFHNTEKSSQDILMLAKHTQINCTSSCCFLYHNPATSSFKPSRLDFSFSFGGNFFVGSLTSFKSSWATFTLLSLFEKIWHSRVQRKSFLQLAIRASWS